MKDKIRLGIVGAAGYAAGEAIRIALAHPAVELAWAASESAAGKPLATVHGDLEGETDMLFSAAPDRETDAVLLCGGHGSSASLLADKHYGKALIIDLAQDHRLDESGSWVYGLPEAFRTEIAQAAVLGKNIANPGCFATAIQLALLPVASVLHGDIHISATTGSTGAGQNPSPTTHFSWRASNLNVYKAFEHQHEAEIHRTLSRLGARYGDMCFVPLRGSFTRGILASVHFEAPPEINPDSYAAYYASHPFVHCVAYQPDVKQVVNTNKCLIHAERHGRWLHVVSVIDNLMKGAAGQAFHSLNIAFGLPETQGLLTKPSAF